ncbi:MAG: YdeI/OmpD-associated family protein [Ignavibacteriaceae bacterium]
MKSNTELPIITFQTQNKWRAWLNRNHNKSNGVWLQLYKKNSGVKSINHDMALDEALCFGWIDGQAKSYDELSYLQKFTPRRKRSIWSKRNTEKVEQLIKEGKMHSSGLAEIEAAKADGRWAQAYDSPANMKIPDDFIEKLSKKPNALAFFKTLNKTNTFSIIWRLQTAKKPETRERRMKAIIEMLGQGKKFH